MNRQKYSLLLALLLGASAGVHAAGSHTEGGGGLDMGSMSMDAMGMHDEQTRMGSPGHAPRGGAGQHALASWEEPPAHFSEQTYDNWGSYDAAKRGMLIYRDQCMMCHGVDGTGRGLLAEKLKHAPADLTNHFHMAPGQGDPYLFWRVTEGGAVEPFLSADSAMPSFSESLSVQQRWEVLAYVHQAFHQGFKRDEERHQQMMQHGSQHHEQMMQQHGNQHHEQMMQEHGKGHADKMKQPHGNEHHQ